MEIYVKTLLRMGIYQIMFLNSISDYAAVNETVNLAKKKNSKVSGFINGILRNVIRQKEEIGKVKTKDDVDYLSIKYSYDKWMIRNWMIHFGKEFTEELLKDKRKLETLSKCDVLVDGRFMINKKDVTLKFRGSSNQRIIDIQESLNRRNNNGVL